ncbi:MAG: hypothetical protein AB7U73_05625, partial [Pirellulales bacterium]
MMIRHAAALCALMLLGTATGWSKATELGPSDDFRDKLRDMRAGSIRESADEDRRAASDRDERRQRDSGDDRRWRASDEDRSQRSAYDRDRYDDRDTRRPSASSRSARELERDRYSSSRYSTGAADRGYLRRRVAQLPGELPAYEDDPYASLSEPQSVHLGEPIFTTPQTESVAPPAVSNYPVPRFIMGETSVGYGPPPGAYGPPPPGGGAFFAPAAWGQPGCLAHCGPRFGVSLYGDCLYLSPRGVGVPFAVPADGIG